MRKLPIFAATFVALAMPGLAADDPVAVRQALMSSNGAAAGMAGAILKGELEYSPAIGKSALSTMHAVAMSFGDYFPEGTADDPRTEASPRIWEDMEGFMAELEELQAETAAALEAGGEDGPADAAAFQAAVQPVLGTCRDCHETYRIDR